jgi:hypothetical protein
MDGTLALHIDVILPLVNSSIDSFVTSLPMFSQTFGDLRQHISFYGFTLQGSHRPINCEVRDFISKPRRCLNRFILGFAGFANLGDKYSGTHSW